MAVSTIQRIEETESKQRYMKGLAKDIDSKITEISTTLHEIIKRIYHNPELAFKEFFAHDTICDFLEQQGFHVTRQAYGITTAFEVLSGEGGRLVSFNAEYDALPDVGHACGHHLIAAASISAFLGAAQALKTSGLPGRVQLLGTPAEESGGGKISLLNAGAYENVAVALMSHPVPREMIGTDSAITGLGGTNFLAYESWFIEYFGKPTHASASPWNGVNAYDAAVAAHNNIGLLRQQFRTVERVHGSLGKRVLACFHAAALATGCEIKITLGVGYADVVNNKVLCEKYAELGNALESQNIQIMNNSEGLGSTDFGNVSYVVPGLHSMFAIETPLGTGCHQHGFQSATGTKESYQRALKTGSLLARTGVELLFDENLYESVKSEWEQNVKARVTL